MVKWKRRERRRDWRWRQAAGGRQYLTGDHVDGPGCSLGDYNGQCHIGRCLVPALILTRAQGRTSSLAGGAQRCHTRAGMAERVAAYAEWQCGGKKREDRLSACRSHGRCAIFDVVRTLCRL